MKHANFENEMVCRVASVLEAEDLGGDGKETGCKVVKREGKGRMAEDCVWGQSNRGERKVRQGR